MSTCTLKQISESDLDLIYNLNHTIFKDEITYDRDFLKRLCKLRQGFIAYENNIPIGYTLFGMTDCNGAKWFTIISIGVLASHRGKKVGKKLLTAVCEKYPDRDIMLHVRLTNVTAQYLYKSVGFQVTDLEENYYPQLKDHAYHMVKKAANH